MTRTIEDIVSELAVEYPAWKTHEGAKDSLRKEFFAAITEAEGVRELAEKVVEVEAVEETVARGLVEKRYPAWLLEAIRPHSEKEGYFEAIIKENPALTPFTFEYDDKVFQRSITAGKVYVDDDALKADDPELWKEVTEEVRVLRPLKDLEPHVMARLQAYIFEGKPKTTLPAPKAAK